MLACSCVYCFVGFCFVFFGFLFCFGCFYLVSVLAVVSHTEIGLSGTDDSLLLPNSPEIEKMAQI